MANALYSSAKALFKAGEIDWVKDRFKLALVNASFFGGYTARNSDAFLCDIPSSALVATASIYNKSIVNGAACADDVHFDVIKPKVKMTPHGAMITNVAHAMVIYRNTGNRKTSDLIAYIDTAQGALPFIPNGGDACINWDKGPNKIFLISTSDLDKSEKKND